MDTVPKHTTECTSSYSLAWTLFPNNEAKSQTRHSGTIRDLAGVIRDAKRVKNKHASSMIKLGTFGNEPTPTKSACLRHDANLLTVAGVELDFDKVPPNQGPEWAFDRLRQHDILAIVHTSHSDSPTKRSYRVLLPFAASISPEERLRYAEIANGILEGAPAPESSDRWRAFYISVSPDAEPIILVNEGGMPLDIWELLNDAERWRTPWPESSRQRKKADAATQEPRQGGVGVGVVDRDDRIGLLKRALTGRERELLETCYEVDPSLLDGKHHPCPGCGGTDRFRTDPPDEAFGWLCSQGTGEVISGDVFDLLQHMGHDLPDALDRAESWCALEGIEIPEPSTPAKGRGTGKPDHLDIALAVRDRIGQENLIHCESGAYRWQADQGVWKRLDKVALKHVVQTHLPTIKGTGPIKKSLVDSVTDLLCNEIYRIGHTFNTGPIESVNCPNGELNLVDGQWQLQPHQREHYRTSQIPVAFDPEAKAPRFQAFLRSVFAGDPDADQKAQAVLELMGYTLMPHCRHEKFILLIGNGANGKSVLLAILEALLGSENVAGVQPAHLGRSFMRAQLHMKLANVVSELRQGEVLDDAALKAIVSGEPCQVEHKFSQPFLMRPFATQWYGTNHRPHVRDFSDGLFRRAVVIEFNNQFLPELNNCDPKLKDKLIGELPGILNLALRAYAEAVQKGFTIPDSSRDAAKQWRMEADQVAQFIEDKCVVDPMAEVGSSELYQYYKFWVSDCGISKPVSQTSFVERLKALGFQNRRTYRNRLIAGIKRLIDLEI